MRKFKSGRKTNSPPPGEAWQWLTLDLLASKAWRERSIGCVRLINFLMIEHLRNGAKENGNLKAPYNQLVQFGMSRKQIAPAIQEAEQRGLLRVERGGKKGTCMTELNRFRLTFAWTSIKADGLWTWQEPTDEWRLSQGEIGAQKGTVPVPKRELVPVPKRELASAQVIEIANSAVVPKREPLSISGEGTFPSSSSPPSMEAAAQRATPERCSKPPRFLNPVVQNSTAPSAALRDAKPRVTS